jgi:eukaryotic-like serine/threonine-protein kinase
MSYCPECGEKVANEDVFCPFCGITLKSVAPVNDSSMSETMIDMPPIAINKETLDSLNIESPQKTPISESPENVEKVPMGNTAENWTMKTDSVEIPAESLKIEDVPVTKITSEYGANSPTATSPNKFIPDSNEAIAAQPAPIDEFEDFSAVPTPAIIQTQEPEFVEQKAETAPINDENNEFSEVQEPVSFEESDKNEWEAPTPFVENVEPSNEFEVEEISPVFDEEVSPIPETVEESESVAPEIPVDFADDDIQPISDESEKLSVEELPSIEAVPDSINEIADKPSTKPEKFTEVDELSQPKIVEPAIAMPDVPFALESQQDRPKYDSVQIIQKEEIQANKAEEPAAIAPEIAQSNDSESQDSSQDARSYTKPNIGNTDTDGRKAAKLKPLEEGVILNGRYEIVRKIGGGGMGAVYLANDRNLGGVLRAVKEMVQSYIESDQQDKAISDFKRESMLLTSLDHPAIPTIYDYFFDEKEARFYLVMKYISGGDLSGRLRSAPEGRVDEKSVTEWAIQVADVLDYLHKHEPPIVYRDLKPANVMVDGNSGRVMLIDFGIARWVNKEEKGVTAVGTMGYAPPELFSGNVEARSDIYSLGSTMFHLLTGADPQSNPLLIFDFQKNPRPRQINSQLSDQIERILMRSVEYNADLRFSSAGQMRDELKEHLSNLQAGKVSYGIKSAPSPQAFSEQNVFCGFCGRQIVATDVFCAFCGAQQPIAQQHFSQPSVSVQPLTAKLTIIGSGELEASAFRLEKSENLLGRRDPMSNIFPEVDLSKYDPQTKISRRHARIWRDGNNFLVEDLGSSNGTTLMPPTRDPIRLLPRQPHNLTSGDKIRLGDTIMYFTVG